MRSSILDVETGSRAESGLVHEQYFRVDGESAGDAETLLLAAGEAGAGFFFQVRP